jgi:hypothetical protein
MNKGGAIMADTLQPVVVGLFVDSEQARQAVRELRAAGFGEDQIGVVARDGALRPAAAAEDGGVWEDGAVAGAATGAGIGAVWALGIAAGVLPAIGPVLAGGLLASVLASAAGGVVVGGVLGALIGLGIPEEEATYYNSELQLGRTLVTVRPGGREAEARAILGRHGAYDRAGAPAEPASRR